jgi:hypothetical protein
LSSARKKQGSRDGDNDDQEEDECLGMIDKKVQTCGSDEAKEVMLIQDIQPQQ